MHILRDLFVIRILLSRVYCGVQGVSLYTHSWRLSKATLDPSKAYLSPPASLSSHTNVVKCWDEVFSLWYHCFHFFRCTTKANRFIGPLTSSYMDEFILFLKLPLSTAFYSMSLSALAYGLWSLICIFSIIFIHSKKKSVH